MMGIDMSSYKETLETGAQDITVEQANKAQQRKYQVRRAKEYLEINVPRDGSEPSLAWCIISDLLRIISDKQTPRKLKRIKDCGYSY